MNAAKLSVVCFVVAVTVVWLGLRGEASDNLYMYKFPCPPSDSCYITQLDHGGAFDFDPQGGAGLGSVRAVSEGTSLGYNNPTAGCSETGGFGRHAIVEDTFGRTLTYAHLSSFGSLQVGQKVLQGDPIGVEGDTGHTHRTNPHVPCAAHLHLAGISSAPGIDGRATSTLTANPTLYTSTNSQIGIFNLPGLAIRDKYSTTGNSWVNIGWTAARSETAAGCSISNCALYVHYVPDPAEGHWGSRQEFRRHPTDGYGAIMAGRWT